MCTGVPTPITNLYIYDDICVSTFTISWDPVTSDLVCGPVSYNVTISPSDGVRIMRITNTIYSVAITSVASNFNVTVVGVNRVGRGEPRVINTETPELSQAVPTSEW